MDWTLVYSASFVLGLTVVGLSFVAGHFGGGHVGHVDGGHVDAGHVGAGHTGGGDSTFHLPLLSPAVLAVFVGMFGAGGLLLHKALDVQAVLTHFFGATGISLASGLGIAWIMRAVLSVAEKNTVASFRDVIGQEVEVLTSIRGRELGEISYTSGGSRQTLIAKSTDGADYGQGQTVAVLDIREGIAYVGPRGSRPALDVGKT